MTRRSRRTPLRPSGVAAAVACALGAIPAAQGFEFSHGEVTGSLDTTVSVGALWRTQGRDPSLIAISNGGTSRDPNADDGNLNYDKGDLTSLAFKTTVDLSLEWRDYGLFVRGTAFYDAEVDRKDGLGKRARDRLVSDAEFLDAFVFGKFSVAGRTLNARAGNQVLSWGESTFIPNGINVLNPVDLSRLRQPGSELREAFIPTPMLWASQELTDTTTIEATWMIKWDKTRIDPRGAYFSTNDFVVDDGDLAYTGFGRRNDQHNPAGVFPVTPTAHLVAPRGEDRNPDDSGQFGVALRQFVPDWNNTEFGLFYANYHSRTPYVSGYRGGLTAAQTISQNLTPQQVAALTAARIPAVAAGSPACRALNIPTFGALHTPANIAALAPIVGGVANATALSALNATNAACATAAGRAGTYFVEYPEDIHLWGLSFNTAGPWGIALQGEYSYRPNQPLQVPSAELLLAALGLANQLTSTDPATAAAVPYGTEISGYRRVKMHQLQMTGTKAFGPTLGAEQFILVGEIGWTHLALPGDLKFAGPGCHLPQPGSSGSSAFNSFDTDCFATRNSWGYRLVGRLDYPNVFGATVSPRLVFSHDVDGVGPTFNESAKAATIGVSVNYQQKWTADLAYTSFFGGRTYGGTDTPSAASGPLPPGQSADYASNSNVLRDRDFVSFSISYAF